MPQGVKRSTSVMSLTTKPGLSPRRSSGASAEAGTRSGRTARRAPSSAADSAAKARRVWAGNPASSCTPRVIRFSAWAVSVGSVGMGAADVEVGKALPEVRGTGMGESAGAAGSALAGRRRFPAPIGFVRGRESARGGGGCESGLPAAWSKRAVLRIRAQGRSGSIRSRAEAEWAHAGARRGGSAPSKNLTIGIKNTRGEEGGQHKNAMDVRFLHGRPHRTADSAARTP